MSSNLLTLESRLRSARDKYGSDIASIIVIFFGVAAILMFLNPQ